MTAAYLYEKKTPLKLISINLSTSFSSECAESESGSESVVWIYFVEDALAGHGHARVRDRL